MSVSVRLWHLADDKFVEELKRIQPIETFVEQYIKVQLFQ